jgi:hypothetical protein
MAVMKSGDELCAVMNLLGDELVVVMKTPALW